MKYRTNSNGRISYLLQMKGAKHTTLSYTIGQYLDVLEAPPTGSMETNFNVVN